MDELREWYEPDGDPREALGRYARRLRGGGALYLGGGVGVEAVAVPSGSQQRVERYSVIPAGTKYDGPLSAVTAAFTAAGASTAVDTPGGVKSIAEASIAARLHELDASEREERATIVRYEARMARRATQGVTAYTAGTMSDDSWEVRRIEEARANLSAIATERARLMSGKLSESTDVRTRSIELLPTLAEAVEAGKPGTNWKQVSAGAKRKLGGILKHYKGMEKPFTQCVADNRKRFGDRAERVCAVVKDLNEKTTKWRKGPKGDGKVAEELLAMVLAAEERLAAVDESLGEGAVQSLLGHPHAALREGTQLGPFIELCERDVILLHLNGDPRATAVLERQLNGRGGLHADDGKFMPKGRSTDAPPKRTGTLTVRTADADGTTPVAESGLIGELREFDPHQPRDASGRFAKVLAGLKKAVRDSFSGVHFPDEDSYVRISDTGDFVVEKLPGREELGTAKFDTEAAKIVRAAGAHRSVKPKRPPGVRTVAVIGGRK